MGVLPYVNNPFIMDRCDVAGVPINATRTAQFQSFCANFVDDGGLKQANVQYPLIRGFSASSWGTPYVKGVASNPIWKLKANAGYTPNAKAAFLGTTGFHAPDIIGDILTGTSDSPFCVFDEAGGFTIFAANANNTGTREITCSAWAVSFHDTNGLDYRNPKADTNRNFMSRGRLSDALVIRPDFTRAAIDAGTGLGHVLQIFLMETDDAAGFCHPMVDFEGDNHGFGAEGERLRIKPSVNVASRGLSPFGLAIARTLQQHGMYIGDNAGSYSGLKAAQISGGQNPWSAQGITVSQDALKGIVWADFEVIEKGWQGTTSGGGGGGGGSTGGSTGANVVQHKGAKVDAGTSCTVSGLVAAKAGNRLIAIMANSGASANAVPPTGFTELANDANFGGTNLKIARKVAAGGETSVTYTCGTASSRMAMVIYEVDGSTADPTFLQYQNALASNSVAFGPDSPKGLEIAAITLGTDASASVAPDWPGAFDTDEKLKTASVNNNVQLITASLKQEGGTVSSTYTWTGTAVTATGFYINFPATTAPAAPAHYRWSGTAWVAVTRYRWSGTAWVATV